MGASIGTPRCSVKCGRDPAALRLRSRAVRCVGVRWLVAVLAAGLLVAACERERWLEAQGLRSFRETAWEEARSALERPGATLVQVGSVPAGAPSLPGAVRVEPVKPLPPSVIQGSGPVVVVASDAREARRVAAQIVRHGRRPVVVARLSTDASGSASLPRFARPEETQESQGDESDGRGARGHRPEL